MQPDSMTMTPAGGPAGGAVSPPVRRAAAWGCVAVVAALMTLLYWETFQNLARLWNEDPNYSHGYIVPFLSLFLAWRCCRRGPLPGVGDLRLGTMYVLTGGLFHAAAQVIHLPPIDFFSLVLVLRGLAIGVGGREWANRLIFPMLFLFFMFPLPVTWTGAFANWLQDVVSRMSRGILQLFIVVGGSGNTIRLRGQDGSIESLMVAEECSGLRQIVAFVALAALVGELLRGTVLYRLLLMAAAVPAAILANVGRVLLMALAARWLGTDWFKGWLHHAPIILTLPLGLGLLLLAGWGLGKLFGRGASAAAAPAAGERPRAVDWRRWLVRVQGRVLVLAASLAACVALTAGVDWHLAAAGPVENQTLRRSLDDFPYTLRAPLPEPKAVRIGPLEVYRQTLHWMSPPMSADEAARNKAELQQRIQFAEDVISRVYHPGRWGPSVRLYMVFSAVGEDRNHHPEICIGVAMGLEEFRNRRRRITLGGDARRPVQYFQYDTGSGGTYSVYYWYYTLDPIIAERHSILQVLHLRSGRLPSLTVQVSTDARLSESDLQLIETSFLTEVDAQIRRQLLPESARMNCERVPIKWIGGRVE